MSLPKKLLVLLGMAALYAAAAYGIFFIYTLLSWVFVFNMCSNGCFNADALVNKIPIYVLAIGFIAGAIWGIRWLFQPSLKPGSN